MKVINMNCKKVKSMTKRERRELEEQKMFDSIPKKKRNKSDFKYKRRSFLIIRLLLILIVEILMIVSFFIHYQIPFWVFAVPFCYCLLVCGIALLNKPKN